MEQDKEIQEAQKKFEELFGSRGQFLLTQLVQCSMTGQPCDITFYNRKPAINVTVEERLFLALAYGAGPATLKKHFDSIKLSNGEVIGAASIWTLHPMPKGGFSDADLAAADMTQAEEHVGPKGETLREMIRNTYRCETREEEDHFLRRFIAS